MAGIDLSAEPRKTAVAVLEVADGVTLIDLRLGATNVDLVAATAASATIGIDCAFGWPAAFVEFVGRHFAGEPLAGDREELDISWRRRLAYRETDRAVIAATGKQPLSVSTDKLGLVAMRCAVLLEDLEAQGRDTARGGSGAVVEVYPGAALKTWGLARAGYKVDPAALGASLDDLLERFPVDVGEHEPLLRGSADAFDALIAAIIAAAHHEGLCEPIPQEHAELARREGWIALPPALERIPTS